MAKNKCLANGCDRPAHARGYCSSHYGQMWRGGECRNIVPKYRQVRDDETIRLERELESMQYHLVESQDIYEKVVGIEGRIAAIRRIKELNINIRIIEKAIAERKRGV